MVKIKKEGSHQNKNICNIKKLWHSHCAMWKQENHCVMRTRKLNVHYLKVSGKYNFVSWSSYCNSLSTRYFFIEIHLLFPARLLNKSFPSRIFFSIVFCISRCFFSGNFLYFSFLLFTLGVPPIMHSCFCGILHQMIAFISKSTN